MDENKQVIKTPKVRKKRKIDAKGQIDTNKQTGLKKYHFSEVQFKFLLKDENSCFEAMEKFMEQAKQYPESSNFDIVANYCTSTEECIEIFKLLEDRRVKPAEACVIFEVLELMLMRFADDLEKFKTVGESIVRRILSAHMGLLYATLAMKNKAHHIKIALKLLTAMVLQGESEARDVQLQFNFTHSNIQPLLQRIDIKDNQDVRQCLINFMLSFLMAGDVQVIKQIIEKRFLHMLFAGIVCDKMTTIELVLSTLMEKVVKNPGINKTTRIFLFNQSNLKHLANLYTWKGPKRWMNEPKKMSSNRETPVLETNTENQQNVRSLIHQFLVEVCCSVTNGINFLDKSFGTGGKNANHVLTSLLQSLQKPYMSPLQTELVVKMLGVCPDLLHWYLPSLKHAIEPRASQNWLNCMQLFKQIYEGQPKLSPAVSMKDNMSPSKVVSIALTTLMPPKEIWPEIVAAVKSPIKVLQFEGLQLLSVLMKRINFTISRSLDDVSQKRGQLREFVGLFREAIRKMLPDVGVWMSMWKSLVADVKKSDVQIPTGIDVCQHGEITTDIGQKKSVDIALPLLTNLCAYQSAIPYGLQSQSMEYGLLLEGVQVVADELQDPKDISLLWVLIVELLSGSEEGGIQWSKETSSGKTFLYVLLEALTFTTENVEINQQVKALIMKMMKNTGLFEGNSEDIPVWLDGLCAIDGSSRTTVLKFMEKVLKKLLKDPYTYTERVMEFMSESYNSNISNGVTDTVSVGTTTDAMIDMILSMEPVVLGHSDNVTKSGDEEKQESFSSLLFSPVVTCVLEMLETQDSTTSCEVYYVSNALLSILRCQTQPLALCLLLYKYKNILQGQQVIHIGKCFLPDEVQEEITQSTTSWNKKKKNRKESLERHANNLSSVHDILEEVFKSSVERNISSLDVASKTIDRELPGLSPELCGKISYQCIQYVMFYLERYTEEKGDLLHFYTAIVINIVRRIEALLNSDLDTSLEHSSKDREDLLTNLISVLLKHPTVKKLLANNILKIIERQSKKRNLLKSNHNVKKCSYFVMEVMQSLPLSVSKLLIEIASPYTSAICDLLNCSTVQSAIPEEAVILNIMAFWQFLDRSTIIKATSYLLRYKSRSHKSDYTIPLFEESLTDMLTTIDNKMYELHGSSFSVDAIKTVCVLCCDSFYDVLAIPLCNLIKRYPPYCEYISEDVFSKLIECVAFGQSLPKTTETKQMSKIVKKIIEKKERRPLLCNALVYCSRYSDNCRKMFEAWVKQHAYLFDVDGWSLWPVIKQYFVSSKRTDKSTEKIIEEYVTKSLIGNTTITEEFTMCRSVQLEESLDAIDAILPYLSTGNRTLLARNIEHALNSGSEHLKPVHIKLYRKITEHNDQNMEQCMYGLNNYLNGLYKALSKIRIISKETAEQFMCEVVDSLNNSPIGPEFFSGIDLFKSEEMMQHFMRLLLKHYYNAECFKIVEHLVTALLISGRLKSVYNFTPAADDNDLGSTDDSQSDVQDQSGESAMEYAEGNGDGDIIIDNFSDESECSENSASDGDIISNDISDESECSENSSSDGESDVVNTNNYNNNNNSKTSRRKERENFSFSSEDASENNENENESNSSHDEISDLDDESESQIENENNGDENSMEDSDSNAEARAVGKEEHRYDNTDTKEDSSEEQSEIEEGKYSVEINEKTKEVLNNIFTMLLSHSKFMSIILEEEQEQDDRGALLDLLVTIVSSCKSVCDAKHLAVFLGSYRASLTSTDRKILALINLYEKHGIKLTQYRPYLWGSAAIEHYSVKKNLSLSLWTQPSTSQVMDCLDADQLWQTVLHFPLRRSLTVESTLCTSEEMMSADTCCDPCFILPLFYHLLSPENVVNCQKFVEHNCLSYVIAALSCHKENLRGLAYSVLTRFYYQLEGGKFSEKEQILSTLDCLKNSIDSINMKLPCIVTIFLAKTVVLMLKPENHMYQMINSFMLLKPNMDVLNVPEFYKLFNSSALEFKVERTWMLNLLWQGLRETADYRIYEKRYTFKLILSYYNSALSDHHTQKQVLKVVSKACSIKTVAFDLVKNHGLLAWIMSLITSSSCTDVEVTGLHMDVFYNLWFAMLDKRDEHFIAERKNPVLPLQFTDEFIALMFSYVRGIKSFYNQKNLYRFIELLESMLRHQEKSQAYYQMTGAAFSCSTAVTCFDIIYLLYHWAQHEIPDSDVSKLAQAFTKDSMLPISNVDTFDNGMSNSRQKNTTSIGFQLVSIEKLQTLLKIPDASRCIENLLEIIKRFNPYHGKLTSDSRVVAIVVFIMHCSLQLSMQFTESSKSVAQSHLDWVNSFQVKCSQLKEVLKHKSCDTLTSVREMRTLLEYVLK